MVQSLLFIDNLVLDAKSFFLKIVVFFKTGPFLFILLCMSVETRNIKDVTCKCHNIIERTGEH